MILSKRANASYLCPKASFRNDIWELYTIRNEKTPSPPPHTHKHKHYENSIAEHIGYAHEKMCICKLQHPDVQNVVVGLFGAFFQLYDDISNDVNPKMHLRWQVHRK